MNTQLSNFDFHNNTIRVVELKGEPWFVGADVLTILYGRASGIANAYNPLSADEKTKVKRSHLGLRAGREMYAISESGLYKLIMRSDKPQARDFQDWVTRVVLPAIRKDGGYVAGEEKVSSGDMSEDEFILKAMSMLQRKVDRLSEENGAMREELTLVTIAEYAALNHVYFTQSEKGRLATKTSQLSAYLSKPVTKQTRFIRTRGGREIETAVNVYSREVLDQAASDLGLFEAARGSMRAAY